MIRVLLAPASPDVDALVREATGGACLALPPGPLPHDPVELFTAAGDAGLPDVVAIEASGEARTSALELAAHIDHRFPGITTVLISDSADELGLDALRAGVRDLVRPDTPADEVRTVFERAGQAARARRASAVPAPLVPAETTAAERHGQVIGVLSPKGGAGRTTVAANLAVGLVRATGLPTVLVDVDLQFGDVSLTLDLTPEYALPDTVHGQAARDTMVLKTFLTRHPSGLHVLPGGATPEAADAVTAEDLAHLLEMLASEFRYVVVDTSAVLGDHTLAVVEQSHDLVLVAPSDVPGLRALRAELTTLAALDLLRPALHVVRNFVDRRTGLSRADVEATLELPVDVEIPTSWGAVAATNQGTPLLLARPRDPAAKALRRLVDRFAAPAARPEGRTRP